eukprot:12769826-Ditylum_brightwellii.AAC.1
MATTNKRKYHMKQVTSLGNHQIAQGLNHKKDIMEEVYESDVIEIISLDDLLGEVALFSGGGNSYNKNNNNEEEEIEFVPIVNFMCYCYYACKER